jgi:hypothetical protein
MKPESYKDLEIYVISKDLAVQVHKMTLEDLPKFEMYEEGSQIRRSSKTIVSGIVEGCGSLQKERACTLLRKYEKLGAKLYNFRDSVIASHRT